MSYTNTGAVGFVFALIMLGVAWALLDQTGKRLAAMKDQIDATALLSRLVAAIYYDESAIEWIKQAPTEVASALADAQAFTGVGR